MARRTLLDPLTIGLICVVSAWVFLATLCVLNYPDISGHLLRNTVMTTATLVIYVGFMIYLRFQRKD